MHSLRNSRRRRKAEAEASPQCFTSAGEKVIPDVKIGDRVIDAKFPCKKKVPAPLNGKWASDLSKTGPDMITDKENITYKTIPGVKKSEAMTPKDADAKKGACKCVYKDV